METRCNVVLCEVGAGTCVRVVPTEGPDRPLSMELAEQRSDQIPWVVCGPTDYPFVHARYVACRREAANEERAGAGVRGEEGVERG